MKTLTISVEDEQYQTVLQFLNLLPKKKVKIVKSDISDSKSKKPNKTTLKVFKDSDQGKNLVRCKDAQDMFKKLGI